MPYIVTNLAAKVKQISLNDLLDDTVDVGAILRSRGRASRNNTATRTYYYPGDIPYKYYRDLDLPGMIDAVRDWNNKWDDLRKEDRRNLYREFRIPKSSGGFRRIDAPCIELKEALRELKGIFEAAYDPKYHTSAFAYITGRCPADAVKRHQRNGSWWFLKTDFSDFFGSTTFPFVMDMLSKIFPFSEVMKIPGGREELRKAIDMCFLDGGLPQGTPISPFLTNVIMIPIDFRLSNDFLNNDGRLWGGNHFVYTRYADDIDISCKGQFDWREIVDHIRSVLAVFNAPYQVKDEKTHYGSRNGRNWILGLMLNKDNKITIGHKKKKTYRAMIHNYAKAKMNGGRWSLEDLQYTIGLTSYYKNVEPDYIQGEAEKFKAKYGYDYDRQMKEDVSRGVFA